MSGDLASRLVQAAARAMGMPAKHLPQDIVDEAVMRSARAAVAATLPLVVAWLRDEGKVGSRDWRDAYTQAANDLEMIATEMAQEGDDRGTR